MGQMSVWDPSGLKGTVISFLPTNHEALMDFESVNNNMISFFQEINQSTQHL